MNSRDKEPLLSNKITTTQLAEELQRSTKTLIRWRRLRVGPPYVALQGRILYDRDKVAAWLDKQCVSGGK